MLHVKIIAKQIFIFFSPPKYISNIKCQFDHLPKRKLALSHCPGLSGPVPLPDQTTDCLLDVVQDPELPSLSNKILLGLGRETPVLRPVLDLIGFGLCWASGAWTWTLA